MLTKWWDYKRKGANLISVTMGMPQWQERTSIMIFILVKPRDEFIILVQLWLRVLSSFHSIFGTMNEGDRKVVEKLDVEDDDSRRRRIRMLAFKHPAKNTNLMPRTIRILLGKTQFILAHCLCFSTCSPKFWFWWQNNFYCETSDRA